MTVVPDDRPGVLFGGLSTTQVPYKLFLDQVGYTAPRFYSNLNPFVLALTLSL